MRISTRVSTRRREAALTLALACAASIIYGTPSGASHAAGAAPAAGPAAEVPRAVFIDKMHKDLPPAFCKDGSYFRSCFRVTAKECDDTAWAATHACLEKLQSQMPVAFHHPEEGSKWGAKITACAGASFELTRASDKIETPKCNDPSAWM